MTINSTEERIEKRPRYTRRYTRVLVFFGRLAISVVWWDILLRGIGLGAISRRNRDQRYTNWARRYRSLATSLGGIWIKVGQFLSARVDVLPESVTTELSGLQDEVSQEDFQSMMTVIEEEFDHAPQDLFVDIVEEPLASASLGQVHRASLPQGESVVIKIQRPQIEDLIATDLSALEVVIGWLKRYPPISRRADLDALFSEFSRTIWEEVDYIAEANNAVRFKDMFAEDPEVRIPEVYKEYSTRRVLTLEDVYFIKITDYEEIEAAGVDRSEVAKRILQAYFYQIFEEGFFHADPHPGNLFVESLDDGEWHLVFVDFGMVGQIREETKQGLRELAIGIATKDLDRLITAYQILGILLPGANLERIKEADAAVFERYWGMSMRELSTVDMREMHRFAREFRDLIYELPFQLPTDLVFLGRCMAILSGLCTGLDPDINFFEELMPFARKMLMDEQDTVLNEFLAWLVELARLMGGLPRRIDSLLDQIERGDLVVTAKLSPELEAQVDALKSTGNAIVAAVIFGALVLGAVRLYLGGEEIFALALAVISVVVLRWVLFR